VTDTGTGKGSEVTYLPASSVAVASPSAGNGLALGAESLASLAAGPGGADFDTAGGFDPGADVDPPALGVPPEEEPPHPASTRAITALAADTLSRCFDVI